MLDMLLDDGRDVLLDDCMHVLHTLDTVDSLDSLDGRDMLDMLYTVEGSLSLIPWKCWMLCIMYTMILWVVHKNPASLRTAPNPQEMSGNLPNRLRIRQHL
eukprot:scpid104543/ scgid33555/ 